MMQEELRDFAERSGIALCGPNCQGIINLSEGAAVSFTLALERHPLRTGKSAFITQSGALGGALFTTAQEMGLGFSYRRPVAEHLRAVQACLEASCEYTRFGSGALGMAFAADGRLDGYYEAHINVWDVAAGLVLVQEAGGRTNDFLGKADAFAAGNVILAATPALVRPLTELLLSR